MLQHVIIGICQPAARLQILRERLIITKADSSSLRVDRIIADDQKTDRCQEQRQKKHRCKGNCHLLSEIHEPSPGQCPNSDAVLPRMHEQAAVSRTFQYTMDSYDKTRPIQKVSITTHGMIILRLCAAEYDRAEYDRENRQCPCRAIP